MADIESKGHQERPDQTTVSIDIMAIASREGCGTSTIVQHEAHSYDESEHVLGEADVPNVDSNYCAHDW